MTLNIKSVLVMFVIEVARYRLSPNVAYTVHVSAKVKSGIERKREREREREREFETKEYDHRVEIKSKYDKKHTW